MDERSKERAQPEPMLPDELPNHHLGTNRPYRRLGDLLAQKIIDVVERLMVNIPTGTSFTENYVTSNYLTERNLKAFRSRPAAILLTRASETFAIATALCSKKKNAVTVITPGKEKQRTPSSRESQIRPQSSPKVRKTC